MSLESVCHVDKFCWNRRFSSMPCVAMWDKNTIVLCVFTPPIFPLHDETKWKSLGCNMAEIWCWEGVLFWPRQRVVIPAPHRSPPKREFPPPILYRLRQEALMSLMMLPMNIPRIPASLNSVCHSTTDSISNLLTLISSSPNSFGNFFFTFWLVIMPADEWKASDNSGNAKKHQTI